MLGTEKNYWIERKRKILGKDKLNVGKSDFPRRMNKDTPFRNARLRMA